MLSTVTQAVTGREWLAGKFSAADIYVASTLRYGMLFGIIPNEGPVGDYIARWSARPASQRADEIEARYMPAEAG
jgi:glutathione S-transferase